MMAGIRRLFAGAFSGPYGEGSSNLRWDRSFRAQPVSEDELQGDSNRQRMRSDCFDLFRTSALAKAAVQRIADYSAVCNPYPITSDEKWNTLAADFFENWKHIADYRQRPGVELEDLVWLSHVADHLTGESFFLFTDGGQLQPIEADRVATPNDLRADKRVHGGIRTSDTGIITHYYVCDRGDGGTVDTSSFRRVKAADMIHMANVWRFDMLHGIPLLHAAVSKIADFDETDTAMRGKVKNEARQFYTQKSNMPLGGGRVQAQGSGFNRRRLLKTEIGMVYEGGDGIELIESKSPNSSYTTHMVEEAKLVAAACNIPYEYLMMIFTAGSYNAQKGARLAFSDTCNRRAKYAEKRMLQRVWNWRIAKAIKAGELPPAPTRERWDGLKISEWNKVEWAAPRFRDIDMAKDVSARSAAWAAGQQSLRDQRTNPYQVLRDKVEDIVRADEMAHEANKRLKTATVNWHHILNAGVPGMTVPDADLEDTSSDEADDDDGETGDEDE